MEKRKTERQYGTGAKAFVVGIVNGWFNGIYFKS